MAITVITDNRTDFIGQSGDSKPTSNVGVGSTFFESDTGKKYIYSGSAWAQR